MIKMMIGFSLCQFEADIRYWNFPFELNRIFSKLNQKVKELKKNTPIFTHSNSEQH